MMGRVLVTRREIFSAAHRLHSNKLSQEENQNLYGPCNNIHGHGHNYTIEVGWSPHPVKTLLESTVLQVTVAGEPDPVTGMVINISDLKVIIKDRIMAELDHKNIDKEVAYFSESDRVSTTENLAVFCWKQLVDNIPGPSILHQIKIWETEKNIVTYTGGN